MKKWFFLFLGFGLLLTACKKSSSSACTYTESSLVAPANEIAYLDSALTASGITNAVQHPSGAFYTVDSSGSGLTPGICSLLTCTYSGYLLGNTVPFDSYTDSLGTSLSLGSLIIGWQRIMPLIKAGSKVTLYIPPTLAYGSVDKKNGDGDVIIPKNSYLKFNIHLISIY